MLIATLPGLHQEQLVYDIISHPLVGGVRYNVGVSSPYPPQETLQRILELTRSFNKRFWLDLKGRQLRITKWAAPTWGSITLNHELEVEGDATVVFRGGHSAQLRFVRDNVIFVDPPPTQAVGAGQSINIVGGVVRVKGYLTADDEAYLVAACKLGSFDFMLSFVEAESDIQAVERIIKANNPQRVKPELVLKLENLPGLEFARQHQADSREPTGKPLDLYSRERLMAARDDFFINCGADKERLLAATQEISQLDSEAIVASQIFSGLERTGEVTPADLSDLYLLHLLGYKHFMFSDGVSWKHFERPGDDVNPYIRCFDLAIAAWERFQKYWQDQEPDWSELNPGGLTL